MDKWKVLTIISLCAVGFCLGVALDIIPSGSASATNVGVPVGNEELVGEIRDLRDEIKVLLMEIQELRKEIKLMVHPLPQPQVRGTAEKESGKEKPPLSTPEIIFTQIPPKGEGAYSRGEIAGRVVGVETPQNYKIVLYALTDFWYVQPLIADPFTSIKSDGTWDNWTHLGYKYAALLVRPSFRPEAKTQVLPPVGGDVIAKGEIDAK